MFAVMLAGGLCLLRGLWVARTDPPTKLCPGARSYHGQARGSEQSSRSSISAFGRATWKFLHAVVQPHRWFVHLGCRYDLRSQLVDNRGCVNCPECGTCVLLRRCIRTTRRVRWIRISICSFLVAPIARNYASVPWRSIAARMPASFLLLAEQHLGERTPYTIRRELRQRTELWELTDDQLDWMIQLLVRDLKADHITGNAWRAKSLLHPLHDLAFPALHASLQSTDWQQRHAAACVLREMDVGIPSEDLIRVTIDGFRARPPSVPAYSDDWRIVNADPGDWWLVNHIKFTESHLLAALDSDDGRQRLHCAAALANARRLVHLDRIAPILIEHLRDNQTRWDAGKAEMALTSLGVDVIRAIEPYQQSADAQQSDRIQLIMRRLTNVD